MRITNIKISARSFQDEEIKFHEGINILIGPNGSGKSNLLDIISLFFNKYIAPKYTISQDNNIVKARSNYISYPNEEKASFSLKLSKEDIENIELCQKTWDKFKDHFTEKTPNFNEWEELKIDEEITISPGQSEVSFTSKDGGKNYNCLQNYLSYIDGIYQLNLILAEEFPFSLPSLYIPPKTVEISALQITLSHQSYDNIHAEVSKGDQSRAKKSTPSTPDYCLSTLAIHRMARNHRKGNQEDESLKFVKKAFEKLNIDFDLKCTDTDKNTYQICLKDRINEITLDKMSTGQKQMSSFILGVAGLSPYNRIIIIDEPELHLHPQWQNSLLEILELVRERYKCQIILATHSPAFIKPNTINYVLRCYKEGTKSKVVSLQNFESYDKDKVSIINSSNNEKLFFAEKVVLVEGITDKIFFEKVISVFKAEHNISTIIEVIDVGGKGNLQKYKEVCEAMNITNYIIADLDYLKQVNKELANKVFTPDEKKVLKRPAGKDTNKDSNDHKSFYDAFEKGIKENDFGEAIYRWEYFKSEYTKPNLEKYKNEIYKAIIEKKEVNIFILKEGAIEEYFPDGCGKNNSNHLDNLIKFCNNDDEFKEWLLSEKSDLLAEQREEIQCIIKRILELPFSS